MTLAFVIEGFLFTWHMEKATSALESRCHVYLTLLVLACAVCSFKEDSLLPAAIVAQGTWFVQVAFTLFDSAFFNTRNWNSDDDLSLMLLTSIWPLHVGGAVFLTRLAKFKSKKEYRVLTCEESPVAP